MERRLTDDYADISPPGHAIWRARLTLVPTTMLYPNAAQWRRKGLLPQAGATHRSLFESVLDEEDPCGLGRNH